MFGFGLPEETEELAVTEYHPPKMLRELYNAQYFDCCLLARGLPDWIPAVALSGQFVCPLRACADTKFELSISRNGLVIAIFVFPKLGWV